jgi:serine phosphatase RsbU (regulator of sigma subunit)
VRQTRDRSAEEIAEEICAAAREFSGRKSPLDDTTAVIIKVKG